jgi:hypothetical protein
VSFLTLAGCSSTTQFVRPTPPLNLVEKCRELDPPNVVDMGGLLQYTVDLVGQYGECAARHNALSNWALEK